MPQLAARHLDLPLHQGQTARDAGQLAVRVYDRLADAEPAWRALEEHGLLTPYQRFDWIAALLAAGAETEGRIAITVVTQNGVPLALLPLVIKSYYGATCARLLGADQSNSDWIISSPGFQAGQETLVALFKQIAEATGGIDLVVLRNQPADWLGMPNPMLTLPHAPAPASLYVASIGGTPVPYRDHRLTAKRRNNLNRGRRRLEEMLGPVRLVRVSDTAMLAKVHAVFLAQRGERFTEMGIANIFAQAPFPEFFRRLVGEGFGSARPALCAHALLAGEEIVATSWGAMAGDHYSQYINSTATGAAGRYSLSGILLADLMDELTQAGIDTFDMGLGDFDYKTEWTEPQVVFDSLFALTLRGQVVAQVMQHRSALKRHIKQTPALWSAAKWLRSRLFALRQH
tara:strand:- start:1720 stop:2922 length:1203 start_codon:yes stop_codon:yes gene_type:complete